ncbi:hypothetical protein BV22DRAFT_1101697 [Leucogyrophana mollusca]|uniref:Uncharacterized protein n=1 Tax=Leucogyrophana mollusca TaxID=85980 RepID=A0ACB8BX03_9AGAM|nr:hypothetical protein BV22DRAFT_1101697 [Leucogyrophana mollusca]
MPVQTRKGAVGAEKPLPAHRRKKKTQDKDQKIEAQEQEQEMGGRVEDKGDAEVGEKRGAEVIGRTGEEAAINEPRKKKSKILTTYPPGVIERGHVYFFYRPKVQHEEAHSIDDIKNFHMLLVPRPPQFSIHTEGQAETSSERESQEMNLISEGADAVPAPEPKGKPAEHFRLITIGKKRLPDPQGSGRKDTFWATVTTVGDNLHNLESGLGEKTYETKTRGTRHEEPVRLAGRGAYAIANKEGNTPSQNETHFGYHLSHPSSLGAVQESLGIHAASSFVLQVKNPFAPVTGPQKVGLPSGRRAEYPEGVMDHVFGRGTKGRQSYGLRFSTCHCVELLEHEGAELLLIAARTGTHGNDTSLGESRGEALREAVEKEAKEPTEDVFKELELDMDVFPAEPLEGDWI